MLFIVVVRLSTAGVSLHFIITIITTIRFVFAVYGSNLQATNLQ